VRQDARRQHGAKVQARTPRDVGQVSGSHVEGIELQQYARGAGIDPESDPRNRARVGGAHDDRIVDLDARPDLVDTSGAVTSLAADWIVTVMTGLNRRRPAESSAKPTTSKVPVAARTVSVSV